MLIELNQGYRQLDCSVSVDALCPCQQFLSHVRTFLGLNLDQAEDKVPCSKTQHSASDAAQTSDCSPQFTY